MERTTTWTRGPATRRLITRDLGARRSWESGQWTPLTSGGEVQLVVRDPKHIEQQQTQQTRQTQQFRQRQPQQQQPWSRWYPGDGGRWFYQGRLKADGSEWEYQFTEGYTSMTPRRGLERHSASVSYGEQPSSDAPAAYRSPEVPRPMPHAGLILADPEGNPVAEYEEEEDCDKEEDAKDQRIQAGYLLTEGPSRSADVVQDDVQHRQGHLLLSEPPNALIASGQPATRADSMTGKKANRDGNREMSGHKKSRKMLSKVVRSQKDLKFNPKKKVISWLSEVSANGDGS